MQGNLILSVSMPEFLTAIENTIRKALSDSGTTQNRLLNSQQVQDLFKVSKTTLQHWRNHGKIPFTRIENKIYYQEAEIMAALQNRLPVN